MKCAIFFVAVCAVAGTFGLPVSESKSKSLVNVALTSNYDRIDELIKKKDDLVRKIREATSDNELSSILEEIAKVDNELQTALKEERGPTNGPSSGPSEGEESGKRAWIRERIAEIREAIVSLTKELASIIWQQARSHGGALQEQLSAAKDKVMKQLSELKEELLKRIREEMIPDDDVPVNYVIDEVFEQIIANLKAQVSDALAVMSDWHNLLSTSGRAKIAAAKDKIVELSKRIAETVREWRKSKESTESSSTESTSYLSDPFYKDELMIMLEKFLEDLRDQLEAKKIEVEGSVEKTEREIAVHLEEVSAQLEASIKSINKMFEEATGLDGSFVNPITGLKNLLSLKMQELKNLIENKAESQKIEKLKQEVMNLRQRILEALRDMFKRP